MTITPLKLLSLLVPHLERFKGQYAVAGGLAASLYRERPRLTNDIDIALDTGGSDKSKSAAMSLLKELQLKPSLGWIAGGSAALGSPIALVIGHAEGDEYGASIDFLLPAFPWLAPALSRAQENMIDFGFAVLPTLTPEDLIIAKAFALSLEPNRFQDLDDLQSIFSNEQDLDRLFLVRELERLKLSLPTQLASILPLSLKRLARTAKRYS